MCVYRCTLKGVLKDARSLLSGRLNGLFFSKSDLSKNTQKKKPDKWVLFKTLDAE